MTTQQVREWISAAMGAFTHEELTAAFDKVAPKDNWKGPIDAVIGLDDFEVVERAVPFFTGSAAEFEHLPDDKVRVRAAGYYAATGA